MIVNEKIWNFLVARYQVEANQEIVRYGIMVNEDTEEAIVEVYLR